MQILNSCKESIRTCLKTKKFSFAHLYSDEKPMDMHIHDCYEIYYCISGGKQFLIDNCLYNIFPGDIFFINQYESHHLVQIDSQVHERIVCSIYPDYLKQLSSPDTDLDACFHNRDKHSNHKISLTPEEQKRFLYYVHRLSDISGYGSDLLEQAAILELMVFLNKRFQRNYTIDTEKDISRHEQVDQILSYINQHISEEFNLNQLSSHFYLSSSYLCRIFKNATGTTINKYVTAKRIALAKLLLTDGYSVTETCERCGFNDYSNFLKAFTKATGVSPKKYSQFRISS